MTVGLAEEQLSRPVQQIAGPASIVFAADLEVKPSHSVAAPALLLCGRPLQNFARPSSTLFLQRDSLAPIRPRPQSGGSGHGHVGVLESEGAAIVWDSQHQHVLGDTCFSPAPGQGEMSGSYDVYRAVCVGERTVMYGSHWFVPVSVKVVRLQVKEVHLSKI